MPRVTWMDRLNRSDAGLFGIVFAPFCFAFDHWFVVMLFAALLVAVFWAFQSRSPRPTRHCRLLRVNAGRQPRDLAQVLHTMLHKNCHLFRFYSVRSETTASTWLLCHRRSA